MINIPLAKFSEMPIEPVETVKNEGRQPKRGA
jgi:hypothetical protein